MELVVWGERFPFVEYVINRLFCNFHSSDGYEDDIDEFLKYLLDHHVSADPSFPIEFTTVDSLDQLYLAFSEDIESLSTPLFQFEGMEKRIGDMNSGQKVILACEIVIIDYLSKVGEYSFSPSNFKLTVKYVEALEI